MYDITGKLLCCVGADVELYAALYALEMSTRLLSDSRSNELNHMLYTLLYDFSTKAETFILKCIL